MENKVSEVCFTETGCCYNLYYHRTTLRYINQNKLLIQKVYPLHDTRYLYSGEWRQI